MGPHGGGRGAPAGGPGRRQAARAAHPPRPPAVLRGVRRDRRGGRAGPVLRGHHPAAGRRGAAAGVHLAGAGGPVGAVRPAAAAAALGLPGGAHRGRGAGDRRAGLGGPAPRRARAAARSGGRRLLCRIFPDERLVRRRRGHAGPDRLGHARLGGGPAARLPALEHRLAGVHPRRRGLRSHGPRRRGRPGAGRGGHGRRLHDRGHGRAAAVGRRRGDGRLGGGHRGGGDRLGAARRAPGGRPDHRRRDRARRGPAGPDRDRSARLRAPGRRRAETVRV